MLNKFRYILKKNRYRFMEKNDVTMEELEKMQKKGAIILDVRSPQEYKEGHIKDALLIPEYELMVKYEKELRNKEQPIVVYCSSGRRSKKAQKELEKLGYSNVYNLYNGFQNYWDFKVYMLKYGWDTWKRGKKVSHEF